MTCVTDYDLWSYYNNITCGCVMSNFDGFKYGTPQGSVYCINTEIYIEYILNIFN